MMNYKKYTAVYTELKVLIKSNSAKNNFLIPPEIPLSEQLGTSRMTLRKALDLAESDGLIRRENRKTFIVDKRPDLSSCGRILFIASGKHGHIILPAIERMYLKLALDLKSANADFRLLLLPSVCEPADSPETLALLDRELSGAKVVIFTVKDCRVFFTREGMTTVRRYDDGSRFYLKLTIDAADLCENCITIDDYIAGRTAAEVLIRGGAKHPVFPVFDSPHPRKESIFWQYHSGFFDVCRESGIAPVEVHLSDTRERPFFLDLREKLWNLWKQGACDGLFFQFDEFADIVLADFFAEGLVPEKFRIFSLNSGGHALSHKPPLTALSTGINELVRALYSFLFRFASGSNEKMLRIKIRPEVLFNNTVSTGEEAWAGAFRPREDVSCISQDKVERKVSCFNKINLQSREAPE